MMADRSVRIVVILLFVNLILAVLYLIYGLIIRPHVHRRQEERRRRNAEDILNALEGGQTPEEDPEAAKKEKRDRKKYWISFIVLLICPVAAPIFFGISWVLQKVFFRRPVDLDDVIFGKEKAKSLSRGDDERERNIVPLEEALAVADKQSLRALMLNILKGDTSESLNVISRAMNSEDSETAHYAAAALGDELSAFRMNVDKLYNEMQEEIQNEGDEVTSYAQALLTYMNGYLSQRIFTVMEQETYVHQMASVATILVETDAEQMNWEYYEWVALRLLEIKDYEECELWCERARIQCPTELSPFTCQLKLYFEMNDRQKFFRVMEDLKASSVVIDKPTLELIRIFS